MTALRRLVRLPKSVFAPNLFPTRSFPSTAMEKGKLCGKVAIVTASTQGIGFAIARHLARDGAEVVVSSRKAENVEKAVKELEKDGLKVMGLTCHVGKPEDRRRLIDQTVQRYGGVDVLVANAGMNPAFGHMLDTTEAQWDKIFEINVKSTFFLCKEVVPHIAKRGGGSIILVSSIVGFQPSIVLGPYSVSKTALLGLCKAMAPQCADMNIRVNCLAPGYIKTNFSEALWSFPGGEKKATEGILLKRLGEPEDCSGMVAFLASDDAKYITSENFIVAGGLPSRL